MKLKDYCTSTCATNTLVLAYPFFVLEFVFSVMHRSGRAVKKGEGWCSIPKNKEQGRTGNKAMLQMFVWKITNPFTIQSVACKTRIEHVEFHISFAGLTTD